jgi:hypothetical protein
MQVGTQFTGSVAPSSTGRWFTHSWPAAWDVVWTVVSDSPQPGAPQVQWDVQVERSSADLISYWINVTNLTGNTVSIEARYAVLNI